MIRKKINYLFVFMVIYVLVFSFIGEIVGQGGDELIVIPYLQSSYKTYIILVFLCVGVFLTFLRNTKYVFDTIDVALIFRAIFLVFPFFYIQNTSNYWGYYATNIIVLLVYELAKRNWKDFNKVFKVLTLFGFILSIQVIATYLIGNLDYLGDYYKYFMAIPIGKTNYIGCFILPAYIFADMDETINKKKKFIILLILVIGMLLLKSRGTILMLLAYYCFKLFPQMKKKGIKLKSMLALLVVGIIVFLFLSLYSGQIGQYASTFIFGTKNGTYYDTQLGLLDRLTSQRFLVNDEINELAMRYPFFGNGPVYEIGIYRAHNFITDAFYQSGIVGTILYLYALWVWFKKMYKFKSNQVMKRFYIPVLVILIQGLIETSVFLIPTDVILWCLIGASISYAKFLEYNGLENIS
ncbi:O-antigen ligase family protein [Paenibacillus sp. FSL L8-0708]|uniref:O-antigen ligase family protein n=1 Tax=Paenibacillus sp. FSL L8-0708 TaxID=2975311 RepID=UPI0030FB7B87